MKEACISLTWLPDVSDNLPTTNHYNHVLNPQPGIYTSQYNDSRDTLTSKPFTEDDTPNFGGSFYSFTKSRVEDIIRTTYPQCLTLRIRMPISDDLHERSFVTKITKYDRVVNIPNSNSILHDLLPLAVAMAEHRETGVYNFTNPGAIGHNEVLSLYKQIVHPQFEWENFTLEEQAGVIKAERSNCELDATKLMGLVERYQCEGVDINVPEIREAYRGCFERMVKNMQMAGGAPAEA
jgi:3,5-epimerase/4-reductase